MPAENNEQYEKQYSESGFWETVKKYAIKVGCTGIHTAFCLYYVLKKDTIPLKAKAIVLGALGYFISPLDVIPDFTPVIGLTDDMAVLAAALTAVAMHVDDEVRARARQKVKELLGDGCGEEDAPNVFDV